MLNKRASRQMSGYYSCHVVQEDAETQLKAEIFVEVKSEMPEIKMQQSPEETSQATTSTKPIVKGPKMNQKEKVQSQKIYDEKDQDEPDNDIFPTKAEIALVVANHMKVIFRQLSDIDQRLKMLEEKAEEIF